MLDVDKSGRITKDEFTEERTSDAGTLGLIGGFRIMIVAVTVTF